MSIVVAVAKSDRVVMASDVQSNFGSRTVPPDNQRSRKIRRVGGSQRDDLEFWRLRIAIRGDESSRPPQEMTPESSQFDVREKCVRKNRTRANRPADWLWRYGRPLR